jgi:glycosyltransferase involved in cell wall biosynthesis
MTILFISSEYPPDTGWGGIGTYTEHIAESLVSRGHTVHVICRSVSGSDGTVMQNGVTVHRVVPGPYTLPSSKCWYPLRALCYQFVPQSLVRLAWAKTAAKKAASLKASGTSFDIIEYPECGAEGFFCKGAAVVTVARLHTPWEIIQRFDELPGPVSDRMALTFLEKSTTRQSVAVSSPTHALAHLMEKRWGLKQVTVYPNPIPVASYAATKGGGWIYTGRIERRKGVETLLNAYAALQRDHPLPPLTLLGRPYGRLKNGMEYAEHIKRIIAEKGIGERVAWIPGVPTNEVASYLARSSVAFFPSLWENFPYACLEAMASGCAVAASCCGGFPEMIDDTATGLLFEPGNEHALQKVMLRFLNEPGLARTLGDAARCHVAETFDAAAICAVAERFYRSLQGVDHA